MEKRVEIMSIFDMKKESKNGRPSAQNIPLEPLNTAGYSFDTIQIYKGQETSNPTTDSRNVPISHDLLCF